MPKVKNEELAGEAIQVLDALVTFNQAGEADVTADVAVFLEQIPGYVVVQDAAKAEKPAKTKKDAAAKAEE